MVEWLYQTFHLFRSLLFKFWEKHSVPTEHLYLGFSTHILFLRNNLQLSTTLQFPTLKLSLTLQLSHFLSIVIGLTFRYVNSNRQTAFRSFLEALVHTLCSVPH